MRLALLGADNLRFVRFDDDGSVDLASLNIIPGPGFTGRMGVVQSRAIAIYMSDYFRMSPTECAQATSKSLFSLGIGFYRGVGGELPVLLVKDVLEAMAPFWPKLRQKFRFLFFYLISLPLQGSAAEWDQVSQAISQTIPVSFLALVHLASSCVVLGDEPDHAALDRFFLAMDHCFHRGTGPVSFLIFRDATFPHLLPSTMASISKFVRPIVILESGLIPQYVKRAQFPSDRCLHLYFCGAADKHTDLGGEVDRFLDENRTLAGLMLSSDNLVRTTHALAILQALAKSALTSFFMDRTQPLPNPTPGALQHFHKVCSNNFHLVSYRVKSEDGSVCNDHYSQSLQMYAKLNAAGRAKLYAANDHPTVEDWIEVMTKNTTIVNDVSCLFTLLRKQPGDLFPCGAVFQDARPKNPVVRDTNSTNIVVKIGNLKLDNMAPTAYWPGDLGWSVNVSATL